MTKQELVDAVAKKSGGQKQEIALILNMFIDEVAEAVANGEDVSIRGLFTITKKLRKAKKARTIAKGTEIPVPAHYIPFAKFAKEIREKSAQIPVE